MREKTYRQLLKLSEIKLARDMAAVGEIRARKLARDRQRDALKQQSVTEFDGAQSSPAALAAYSRWTDWSQHRRRGLDTADQSDDAELAAARQVLSRSFGETKALDFLLEQERKAARKLRSQRAERSGLPPDD